MKQVARQPRDGRISVAEVPLPTVRRGWVLVENRCSLISAGTERSKVELDAKGLIGKAKSRPDLVRKVVEKARAEGVRVAVGVARERLAALTPLGYSSAGVVLELGPGVEGLAPGERVACGGAGWANHAEVVSVPRNLIARVPDSVPLESAAYATVGAIALHGVRRSEAAVGERVGVIGLGLVGQLAIRILRASGCESYGVDLDPRAVGLARQAGATAFERDDQSLESTLLELTDGIGLDAVLLCAATSSADPLHLGARLARERGRLVIVGDMPVELNRDVLYEKELDLRMSRSYGPGRYDREYEEHGRDLPPAYVRWTEQRNLQVFVDLLAAGQVDPAPLTTHRFPVGRAEEAYRVLSQPDAEDRPFGILITYDGPMVRPAAPRPQARARERAGARIGVIGAGAFARATLLPALQAEGAQLVAVTTQSGLGAADVARRFAFERTAQDSREILEADDVDSVVIATRHSSHADIVAAALRAGKAVFVEKPLALSHEELSEVELALSDTSVLMVGFNRRYAPLVERLRERLGGAPGSTLLARVNAGPLPRDHWLHDPEEGGGRLLGEGCHFVDLLYNLADSQFESVYASASPQPERPLECSDSFVASLRFSNGTVASLLYSGRGDPRLPKERIEVFGGGLSATLDDFRRLESYLGGRREVVKSRSDKGHRAQLRHFVGAAAGQMEPPSIDSYLNSTRATLTLADSLRVGLPIDPNRRPST